MTAISELYSGPLPDFIRRRDALAKQLRADGDKEAADRIKKLRKPSRPAWALNVAAAGPLYERLVAAVRATVAAHAKGDDVRGAMADMREALRALAAHASEVASANGQGVDAATLAAAIQAVLGDTQSFELLSQGELVEIPEAGGLDFLATMSAAPSLRVTTNGPVATTPAAQVKRESRQDAKAREALERAEADLLDLRAHMDRALRILNQAEAALEAAERRLDEATRSADAARANRDGARAETVKLAASMEGAERSAAKLREALA